MRRGFDYSGLIHYLGKALERAEWTPFDKAVNIFFVSVLLLGVAFFVLTQITDFELRGPFTRRLFPLFFLLFVAYLIWLTGMVFGLPFGLTRFQVVSTLTGIGVFWFLAGGVWFWWQEIWLPLAKGYRRCPRCKSVILKLYVSCPHCQKKFR